MNTPNDGGPVITQEAWNKVIRERDEARAEAKTSLRDRFAGNALPAVISILNTEQGCSMIKLFSVEDGIRPDMVIAKMAYEYADAMLAARDGKEGA